MMLLAMFLSLLMKRPSLQENHTASIWPLSLTRYVQLGIGKNYSVETQGGKTVNGFYYYNYEQLHMITNRPQCDLDGQNKFKTVLGQENH